MASPKDLLQEARKEIKEVSVAEVHKQLQNGNKVTILDVREKDEWNGGVIPGAKLLPRGTLEFRVEELVPEKDAPLVVHCAAGFRSLLAAHTLKRMGYTHVTSMAGGFNAWKQAGYEVIVEKPLTSEQLTRYGRHIILPEVGEAGQKKLLASKVLLIGAGGLGSPAAYYLAAAGIGTLGIVDFDVVDASNLQRQIIHKVEDVGKPKTESAKKTIASINPDVNVKLYPVRLSSENVMDILKDYDVVVDGCDNFSTRYLVNDACYFTKKPNVYGSIFRFEGQSSVFVPGRGCYRCLYPEPPPPEMAPSCQEAGVLGVLPGIIGLVQSIETIKLLLGKGDLLVGRMLLFDSLGMKFREVKIQRDPQCPLCGDKPTIKELIDYEAFCGDQHLS